jgi:hypothetical protein
MWGARLFYFDLNQNWNGSTKLVKFPSVRFGEDPFRGSGVSWERTNGLTEINRLFVGLREFLKRLILQNINIRNEIRIWVRRATNWYIWNRDRIPMNLFGSHYFECVIVFSRNLWPPDVMPGVWLQTGFWSRVTYTSTGSLVCSYYVVRMSPVTSFGLAICKGAQSVNYSVTVGQRLSLFNSCNTEKLGGGGAKLQGFIMQSLHKLHDLIRMR